MGFSFVSLLLTSTLSLLLLLFYVLFSFILFLLLFLPPTPNPLPSGKRALRFASPCFNLHHFYLLPSIPRLYVTLAEKRRSILILPFTCRLLGSACLKTEELRWGSPTATTPFEPLDLAPKEMLKDILPFLELNGQFGKLTDRSKGTPAHELNGQFDKLTDQT